MPIYDFILQVTKYGVAALFLGCIFFYVVIPLFRGLNQGMPDFPKKPPANSYSLRLNLEAWQSEVEPPPQPEIKQKQILEIAKKNPSKTAQILRAWLAKGQE